MDTDNKVKYSAAMFVTNFTISGKNYIVMDGDIIFFKFNAGAGLTTAKKK